ncbi:MAG: hypothetical protein MUE97_07095 [Phycisphaerales bacterium]|nr:hypothetical protein [Phycisphaerales bacterium]
MRTRSIIAATTALVLAGGSALALPPIMDRIPAGMAVVVVIPNMEQMSADVASIGKLVGAPAEMDAGTILSQLPGGAALDAKGALTIVVPEWTARICSSRSSTATWWRSPMTRRRWRRSS